MSRMCVSRRGGRCRNEKGDNVDVSYFTNMKSTIPASSLPVVNTLPITLTCHEKIEECFSCASHGDPQDNQINGPILGSNEKDSAPVPSNNYLGIEYGDAKVIQSCREEEDQLHNSQSCQSYCVYNNAKDDVATTFQQTSTRTNIEHDFLPREEVNDKLFSIFNMNADCQLHDNKACQTNETSVKSIVTERQYNEIDLSHDKTKKGERSPKRHGVIFSESNNVFHIYQIARERPPRKTGKKVIKGSRKTSHGKKTSSKVITPSIPLSIPTEQFVLTSKETTAKDGGVEVCFDNSCFRKFVSKLGSDEKDINQADNPLFRIHVNRALSESDNKLHVENNRLQGQKKFDCDKSNNAFDYCDARGRDDSCFAKDLQTKATDRSSDKNILKSDSDNHCNHHRRTLRRTKILSYHQVIRKVGITEVCENEKDMYNNKVAKEVECEKSAESDSTTNAVRPDIKAEENSSIRDQTSTNNYSANLYHQNSDFSHQPICYRYLHQVATPHAACHQPVYIQATKSDIRSNRHPVYQYVHREPLSTNVNFASSYTPQYCQVTHCHPQNPNSHVTGHYLNTPIPFHQENGTHAPSHHHHYHQTHMTHVQESPSYQLGCPGASVSHCHSGHEHFEMPPMNVNPTYEPVHHSQGDQCGLYDKVEENKLLNEMATQVHAYANMLRENEVKIKALEQSLHRAKSPASRPPIRGNVQSPKRRDKRDIPPPVHLHPPSRPFFPTHHVLTRRPFYFYR